MSVQGKRVAFVTGEEDACFAEWRRTGKWQSLPAEFIAQAENAGLLSSTRDEPLIPWEQLHFVAIESRPEKQVAPPVLELLRAIMSGEFVLPEKHFYTVFGFWASEKIRGLYAPNSLRAMFIGFRAHDQFQGWGVFYQIRDDAGRTLEYAIMLPGFGAYEFVPSAEFLEDEYTLKHAGRHRKPSEEPVPEKTPVAVPIVLETDEERAAIRTLWVQREHDATVAVETLERELAASMETISGIENELRKLTA